MTTNATRRVEFDAAHRLPNHDGKCRRLHGHRYVVDVSMQGPLQQDGPKRGMVIDFSDVDDLLADIVGRWDHRTILFEEDPLGQVLLDAGLHDSLVLVPFMPTAENFAGYIGGMLFDVTDPAAEPRVVEVRVQETPRGWAVWRR